MLEKRFLIKPPKNVQTSCLIFVTLTKTQMTDYRLDVVCEPPCGQGRHGPAGESPRSRRRARTGRQGRAECEGSETEPGFPPGPTHGGHAQEGGVVVCGPSHGRLRDPPAGGAGHKLWEEGRRLVRPFHRGAHPPVRWRHNYPDQLLSGCNVQQ